MVLCCKRASYVNSKIYVLINAISNIFFFFISPHSTETVTVYNSVLRIRNRFFFQPHGSSPHFFFKLSHLDLAKKRNKCDIYILYLFCQKVWYILESIDIHYKSWIRIWTSDHLRNFFKGWVQIRVTSRYGSASTSRRG